MQLSRSLILEVYLAPHGRARAVVALEFKADDICSI
jgi:hypothetical protein